MGDRKALPYSEFRDYLLKEVPRPEPPNPAMDEDTAKITYDRFFLNVISGEDACDENTALVLSSMMYMEMVLMESHFGSMFIKYLNMKEDFAEEELQEEKASHNETVRAYSKLLREDFPR